MAKQEAADAAPAPGDDGGAVPTSVKAPGLGTAAVSILTDAVATSVLIALVPLVFHQT